jgi:hypothetical protein
MGDTRRDERPYEPPRLVELGGVEYVTATIDKRFNATDGLTFMGTPIGNASP